MLRVSPAVDRGSPGPGGSSSSSRQPASTEASQDEVEKVQVPTEQIGPDRENRAENPFSQVALIPVLVTLVVGITVQIKDDVCPALARRGQVGKAVRLHDRHRQQPVGNPEHQSATAPVRRVEERIEVLLDHPRRAGLQIAPVVGVHENGGSDDRSGGDVPEATHLISRPGRAPGADRVPGVRQGWCRTLRRLRRYVFGYSDGGQDSTGLPEKLVTLVDDVITFAQCLLKMPQEFLVPGHLIAETRDSRLPPLLKRKPQHGLNCG